MDDEKNEFYPQKEKTSYVGNIFVIMIIPISLFILELWVENGSNDFYNQYISKFVMYKIPVLGVPVLGIIFFGSIFYLYSKLAIQKVKNDLRYQKKVNNYYLEQLEDKSKLMWRNHKKIMGIKDKEILNQVIRNYVLRNKYIYGIQLYTYTTKVKYKKTKIKINYKRGYIDEDININAMMQNYFEISTDLYNDFHNMILKNKDNSNIDNKIKKTEDFIKKYTAALKTSPAKDYNYEDANKYALSLLAIQILFSNFSNNLEDDNISILKNNKEKYLKSNFRTGIFRGILIDSDYLFKHESNSSDKDNRFYVSIPYDFQNEKCIFIITFNNEILKKEEGEEQVINLCDNIIKKLDKELESKYNKNIENNF